MPIYEFFCPDNRRIYSFFARSLRFADRVPRCPDNQKWRLEKMISGFAITGAAKDKPVDEPGGEDDAKMEAAMGAMEKEFGHIAESDNPD
ncbi:MAG: FmdB family transcriptional regulator, partial [Chthoniobacteraceae bacterium]